VEGSCEFGIEPLASIKCWEPSSVLTTGGFSSGAQLHISSYQYILMTCLTANSVTGGL
jgi:hypothetical protein